MRVSELRDVIISNYNRKETLLFLGPPGIGKSESVRDAAEKIASKLGREFVDYNDDLAPEILKNPDKYFVLVDFRLSEVEPSDLIGIPRERMIDGVPYVVYVPHLWARVLQRTAGILFLDEITNVQRDDVISVAYKITLDRKVGQTKINGGVLIIAAGNTPENSAIARPLPAPLLNRFKVYEVDPPSVDNWCKYMDSRGEWDVRIAAFLYAHKEFLYSPPDEVETLKQYPTPRSWTSLALISKSLQARNLKREAEAYVGREVATKLHAFLNSNVNIDDLIKEPEKFRSLNLDQKYMAAIQLASKVKKDDSWIPLAKEILEDRGELFIVFVRALPKNVVDQALKKVKRAAPEAFKHIVEIASLT